MAKDTSQRIDRLLRSLPALKAISVQLEGLTTLDHALRNALPGSLRGRVRVAARDGNLVSVAAANAACAARLRMMRPRLLRALTIVDHSIQDLRVVVDVGAARFARRADVEPIGQRGRASLAALQTRLPEGPLREAIGRLAGGARRSDREDEPFQGEEGEH